MVSGFQLMASSRSMIFSNSASVWVPFTNSPLMKKPGVPLTPAWVPSFTSCSIWALNFPPVRQVWNDFSSSPSVWAVLTRPASSSLADQIEHGGETTDAVIFFNMEL